MKHAAAKIFENCKILSKNNAWTLRSGDVDDDPDLLEKVITGDESRVYDYTLKTKLYHPNG